MNLVKNSKILIKIYIFNRLNRTYTSHVVNGLILFVIKQVKHPRIQSISINVLFILIQL